MISFKGTPLFGQDSIPQNTSKILAIAGTVLFWLILFIVLIFAKPIEKKPKYKEVQIVLSRTPTVKQEETPAPAEAASSAAIESSVSEVQTSVPEPVLPPAPVVQETPAVKPKVEAVAVQKPKAESVPQKKEPVKSQKTVEKKTETKTVEKKTETKPVQKIEQKPVVTEPVEYAIDPMEALAQQTQKKQKKEFDWSMFDDNATEEASAQNEIVKKVQNDEPLFSGSAATVAETSIQPVTSTSSTNKNTNKTASTSTASSLAKIANSNYSGKAVNGVESQTTAKTAVSGNGKIMMEMSNGSSRALLNPEKPVINLSEEASITIDGSRTVSIKFRVNEVGNVLRGEIKITPESILSDIVKREILDQISRWIFESADYSANAEFEYRIVKR